MSNMEKKKELIINVLFAACIAAIVYVVVKYALGLFMPFIIALALVSMFRPWVLKITKNMRINSNVLTAVIMGAFFLLLGGALSWGVFRLAVLIMGFFTDIPVHYNEAVLPAIITVTGWIEEFMANLPYFMRDDILIDSLVNGLLNGLQSFILSLSQSGISFIGGVIGKAPDFTIALIFTILIAIFLSIHYDTVFSTLQRILPPKITQFALVTKKAAKRSVIQYLKAYLILMCITFVELSIGLTLIKTSNSIAVAAMIAFFDALPVVGTGAVMIPWILLEFIKGNTSYGIGLAIVYGIITVVRNFIEPKIVGDQLGLNPVLSLVSIYAGYKVYGVLGMILFPMLVQVLLVLFRDEDLRPKENEGAKGGEKGLPEDI